jgi:membrane-bound ClpP family serine protease
MSPTLLIIGAGLASLAQEIPPAIPSSGSDIAIAVTLLAVALVLLLLEFLVVSYGLLAIAALGCAITGLVYGFSASPTVGWTLLALTPILTLLVVQWGLRRLMRSRLVPKAEITDDAGYRHVSELLGITVGAAGVLTTDAMPTGRARFPGGEIDVLMEGPAALKGAPVLVRRIEGPTVIVTTQAR